MKSSFAAGHIHIAPIRMLEFREVTGMRVWFDVRSGERAETLHMCVVARIMQVMLPGKA